MNSLRWAIISLVPITLIAGTVATGQPYALWDPSNPVPTAAQTGAIPGVQFHIIKRRTPDTDGFDWLHGVSIIRHANVWYVSFGHNKGAENTATEIAQGLVSHDHGVTWSDLFTIGGVVEPEAVSHGVFLSRGNELWAFHGSFSGHLGNVHTRGYVRNEQTGKWNACGIVAAAGFWPMQRPQQLANGNWIMSGISVHNGFGGTDDPAAVAISRGRDLTHWDVVIAPKPPGLAMWGESAVICTPDELLMIARNRAPIALVSSSKDSGRTWSRVAESNMPMVASKPCAGILSTGQMYLIGTTITQSGNRRRPLTIAVSQPGARQFCRVYRIRDAVAAGPGESTPNANLSYPDAVEYEGKLYVAYSNDGGRGANRNSAELAVIPIEGLSAGL